MDRVTAIRKSLVIFVCGIIGFLPFVGIVPAVYALYSWETVRTRYRGQWNPASAYLTGGVVLALVGLLGSLLIAVAAILAFMS